jgi:hypothetical protein
MLHEPLRRALGENKELSLAVGRLAAARARLGVTGEDSSSR